MPPVLDAVHAPPATETISQVATQPASPYRASWLHVAFILLTGLLARVPFYLAFRPIWSGDSPGYSEAYFLWTQHIFFRGERTPVYPLFLGAAQWLASVPPAPLLSLRASYAATLMQSALDVLAAAFFYFTLRSLRIRGSIALGASLFIATIPAVCAYEMNILNMSLAFASLGFVTWLFLLTMNRLQAGKDIRLAVLSTGAALAVAVLNRPDLLIFFVVLLPSAAILACKPRLCGSASRLSSRPMGLVAWIGFPVAIALLAWMTLMYVGIGEFRITTLSGWNRSRTVYNMFDRVDPEDHAIGEIMSRTYLQEAGRDAQVNLREIMWPALGELLDNYSRYPITDPTRDPSPFHLRMVHAAHNFLGLVEIPCEVNPRIYCWQRMRTRINTGDYLGEVSGKLARKYPVESLHNVAANFLEESFNFRYTDAKPAIEDVIAPSADSYAAVRNNSIAAFTTSAANAEAPLLALMYVVTLGYAVCFPFIVFRKQDGRWLNDAAVASLAAASVGTIAGTCVLAGLNRVYTLPHFVVFVICTSYALENWSRIISFLLPVRPLQNGL